MFGNSKANLTSSTLQTNRSRFLSSSAFLKNAEKDAEVPLPVSEDAPDRLEATSEPTRAEEEVKADHHAVDPIEHHASPIVEAAFDPVAASRTAEIEGRSVFVGGLSWNLDNEWLKEEVEKALEITEGLVSVRIARDHMGKSKG
jgi:hypothetical protein